MVGITNAVARVKVNPKATGPTGTANQAARSSTRKPRRPRKTFWKIRPHGTIVEGSEVVCSMEKDGTLMEVRDTGERLYGNRICARLEGKGWEEVEGPGVKAERER